MKTKDLITITTAAVATTALTVATFGGAPLEAGGDAATASLKIPTPTLVSHGVNMTLAARDGRVFKAGDQPAFELKAVNGAGQPATVCVSVSMNSSSIASRMSRVATRPIDFWQEQRTFTLKPNETKMLTFAAKTNLPPNSMISVRLTDADPAIKTDVAVSSGSFRPGIAAQPFISALYFSTFTNAPVIPVVAVAKQ